MATLAFYFLDLSFFCNLSNLTLLSNAISNCGGSCTTPNDCADQLICINGKCDDDPDSGTHTCGGGEGGGDGDDDCQPSDSLTTCNDSISHDLYNCSPTVMSSTTTSAILTINNFSKDGDGGDESECDDMFHDNSESVVALSTGWFRDIDNGQTRCGEMIEITASNGRSTMAKVVDECDSAHGCDREHAYQPPCRMKHRGWVAGSVGCVGA